MSRSKRLLKFTYVDPVLLVSTIALVIFGIVMVYSASSPTGLEKYGDSSYFLRRQVTYLGIGLFVMAAMFFIQVRWLRRISTPAMFVVAVLLLITGLTHAGVSANHAKRWLSIAGFAFQPSELAKPAIVLFVASYLATRGEAIRDFRKGLLPLLLTVGSLLVLVLRQPDFGTTVALAMTVILMLFVARANGLHILGLGALALIGVFVLIKTAPYRMRRFTTFVNPWRDPQGSGFQIIQSFIAFDRGGLRGQGLGDGTQKLLYLPEAHTDFIYSVIAEELGLVGSLIVIFFFACLVVQGFRLALRIREPFGSHLALGLTAMIGIQAILNMAVVMGLLPTKGLTLPLISYGGTSLIVTLACIGILLSLSATISMSTGMARRVTS